MYVHPKVSGEEAQQLLLRTLRKKRFPRKTHKRIQRVECLYIPYYLFRFKIPEKKGEYKVLVLDGILGESLSAFNGVLSDHPHRDHHSICPYALSPEISRQQVKEKYQGRLLESNMRNKKQQTLGSLVEQTEFYYPFWIGYFQKGDRFDFKALDGISGSPQDIRMRKIFLKAFRNMSK
jgi:hypothetical protein